MSMKYTVIEEREYPTQDEIKEASREYSPIEPKSAMLITSFVFDHSKEVFKLMKANYGGYDRNSIASDVATAYCDENHIKWRTLRVISVSEYPTHFVIESLVIL